MMPLMIGPYKIKQKLGEGGFAVVYLADHPSLPREVAVKVLKHVELPSKTTSSASANSEKTPIKRFQEEVEILVKLEIEGVVRIYDFAEDNGRPYLVMQYMKKGTLEKRINGHPLPLADIVIILNKLCHTLDLVHQNAIIHRDLKPANILFDTQQEAGLSDFGIAQLTETTQTASTIGTPNYMAPEQFNNEQITAQTDIYQMGAVLYEMLTGKTPFAATSYAAVVNKVISEPPPRPSDSNPSLSMAYDDIIAIAMAKTPSARYKTAAQLAVDFEAVVNGANRPSGLQPFIIPVSEKRPPLEVVSPPPSAKINKMRATAVILILSLLLISAGFFLFRPKPIKPAETIPNNQPDSIDLNVVFVSATPLPGALEAAAALTTLAENDDEPNATQTTQAIETMTAYAQATETSLFLTQEIPPTETPSTTPTPTPIAAVSAEDIFAMRIGAPIYIDGDLSEWPVITPVRSDQIIYQSASWDGSEDLLVTWLLAWDDANLYVGVTAVDDTHVQTQTGNQIFNGDSVSLQIDVDRHSDLSDRVSPDDFQIDLSPGDFDRIPPSAHRFQGNEEDWMDNAPDHAIFVRAQQTPAGYVLEAAIPWQDLGIVPLGGETLGLALNATDNDTPDTAVQELFISNVANRQFNTPNSWGTLTLQGRSATFNRPVLTTSTPRPSASKTIEDFEYSNESALDAEYWLNSPGNVVTMQLVGPPNQYSGQQALAISYQFQRDTNDYVGIERNLTTPMDWTDFESICFWLNNPDFTGFLIFQFKEQDGEAWKHQEPLRPGLQGEICLNLNDDVFSIDSTKLNNLMDLTAVDNYAIYFGDGGVSAGTVYLDAIRLEK